MHGAKPKKITNDNDAELKSKVSVIKLDYGVAVVSADIADVLEARDGIEVEWDFPSVGRKYDSDRSLKDYVKVSEDSSVEGIAWPGKAHVPWAPAVKGNQKDYDAKMKSDDFKVSLPRTQLSIRITHKWSQ